MSQQQVDTAFAALIEELAELAFKDHGAAWPDTYASVGTVLHPGSTEKLMEYWAHGEGAAKIRWPEPCAFCRCLEHLAKYFPKNTKGLCANLEKRATGHWPNPQHSRTHHCPC
jgi:hypothetical protein